MVITTRFDLGAPVDAAWAYLLDVPKIAHCVPGASLTDVVDDKTFAECERLMQLLRAAVDGNHDDEDDAELVG